ncbi:nucleotide exchange factor GrpE [Kitasatospora sp. GP82]|uniref:nucleotide exchange factor GrpE n=1 Tax=Kitasatospora sp. GP82 TaxID=3035089 RepID=UPI002474CC26|nr:nucleotide exchange factor GrpE [Kitasatospora sp. GP82]MDH6123757.1 molecular chaperone GrpE [Kitasatospora sp. GP82]
MNEPHNHDRSSELVRCGHRRPTEPDTSPTDTSPTVTATAEKPSTPAELEALLTERTADLQRVQADFENYRKRVRRDRLAIREIAVANVLLGLLPVLDALDRAREYGELTGGFGAVADELTEHLTALGLLPFGEPGDPFDPTRHEALVYSHSPDVDVAVPTCTVVHRPGYRVGVHLLRPAQVTVTAPGPDPAPG